MEPKLDLTKEYGLVLEGGGARGAYQIGAWRALSEAGVKIKGVAGTSVGALNGAFVCMNDLAKAEQVWCDMKYSRVFKIGDEMIDGLLSRGLAESDLAELGNSVRQIVSDRGLDITPLKELIAETLDPEKIRNSPVEFYATTFSLTERREIDFDMRSATDGEMRDMLLASSYLPGFKAEKLGGKYYMDGGTVNNVPLNVLAKRGYKDVIVIRIYGVGVDREKLFDLPDDMDLYRIEPETALGGILDLDGARIRKNMTLGYYDAKRLIYGLCGRGYYIDVPEGEGACLKKLFADFGLFFSLLGKLMERPGTERFSGLSEYRLKTERIFPAIARKLKLAPGWDYRTLYGALLEACAKKLKLERFAVYEEETIRDLAREAVGAAETE